MGPRLAVIRKPLGFRAGLVDAFDTSVLARAPVATEPGWLGADARSWLRTQTERRRRYAA
jgi:hypothetical protein